MVRRQAENEPGRTWRRMKASRPPSKSRYDFPCGATNVLAQATAGLTGVSPGQRPWRNTLRERAIAGRGHGRRCADR